jgi:hypothetical protein
MADCTGDDLNYPPAMTVPEPLSSYGVEQALAKRRGRWS